MSRIIPRAEWGARRAKARTRVADTARYAFMLHYSTGEELGREDTAQWVREVQAFHMGPQRGWSDIGYNFLVDAAGRIYEGRGWGYVGAHCPGYNTSAYGVCFLGDDDAGQDVTPAARRAIRHLYELAQERAGRSLRVMGHRDGKATACPGDELYAFVRSGLTEGLDDAPAPAPAAPSTARPVPGPTGVGAPAYPLPAGWYFGPRSGPRQSVSGYHGNREHLRRWQRRMIDRGWNLGRGGADGLYGDDTERVARAFQQEKGLTVDGLIGPQTWAAAWTAPIT